MRIVFNAGFIKKYKKLRISDQSRFRERLKIFQKNPFDHILNNHGLKGKYTGYRSINISGDMRAVYKLKEPDIYVFMTIGTHSELYR